MFDGKPSGKIHILAKYTPPLTEDWPDEKPESFFLDAIRKI